MTDGYFSLFLVCWEFLWCTTRWMIKREHFSGKKSRLKESERGIFASKSPRELWLYDRPIVWTLLICPEYEIYVKKEAFLLKFISSKNAIFPFTAVANNAQSMMIFSDGARRERTKNGTLSREWSKKDSNCMLQQCKKKDHTKRFWKRLRQWHNPERSSRKFCHKL